MMRVLAVAALLVACVVAQKRDNYFRVSSPYTYSCIDSLCVRQERSEVSSGSQSQEECQLTCGQFASLWPKPTGQVQMQQNTVEFYPTKMRVTRIQVPSNEINQMVDEATRYFERNLHFLHPDFPQSRKTPYTDREKTPLNDFQQREILQRNIPFNHEFTQQNQQQQQQQEQLTQQTTAEFNSQDRSKRFEQWHQYSPFMQERSTIRRIERHNVDIEITITTPVQNMRLDTDESYNIETKTVGDTTTVKITAPTYFGARHALETLSQTMAYSDENESIKMVSDFNVADKPEFRYRGFMLDTSRNYYNKEEIMGLMDAMSQNKMNYFQWHITDSHSFPMYSRNNPKMSYYGAYSAKKVYYPEDIQEVVNYARLRGINVVPELNAPGHSSAGWEFGEKSGLNKLTLCNDKAKPWFENSREPPSGQLNPVNPEVYNVLAGLYKDMVDSFDPEMLHMGGDGVSFKCWQNSKEVTDYLTSTNRQVNSQELFKLWNEFQSNAYAKLQESARPNQKITPIIHSSSFVRNFVDKQNYVVELNEFTDKKEIADYVNDGYRVIFSNLDQWRVDCAGSSWYGEKSLNCPKTIPTWENFYRNSPLDTLTNLGVPNVRDNQQNLKKQILGGTASLFSSETDGNGLQSKAWPRVSAFAERLWSDSPLPLQGVDTTRKRLSNQRNRMVERGIKADALHPEYCSHVENGCYSQEEYAALRSNIPQTQQTAQ